MKSTVGAFQHKEERQVLISFFKELIDELKHDFSLLELRPKHLPSTSDYFEGDFDFLIEEKEFTAIFKLLYETCKNRGINFNFIQKFPNKKKFHFFIKHRNSIAITLELWTAIEFTKNKKPHTFSAENIFKTLQINRLRKSEILSLIYVTHLFHKQKNVFSEENKYRFQVFLEKLKAEQTPISEKVIGILEELKTEKTSLPGANNKALHLLNKSGVKSKKVYFPMIKLYAKAIWHRLFHLYRTIPVVGPDGVGKGIVSELALEHHKDRASFRFKDLYRMRIFYKHIVLRFFNPNDLKKNRLDEDLGYYIFTIASFSIYILPIYLKGKKVLLDRYYLDYYAKPIRYLEENQNPKKLKGYSFLLYLTPVPQQMIFMGCKDQSLKERKNELSQTAVDYLQDLYIEFILKKKIPEILFISTENQVETSVKAMQDFLPE
ncbi:MAG TPA: hypothetical protein VK021_11930 [Flavobacteriaceae bacterium]|nr:hypothetical protein [Flavobacteriaceae bacterium]